MSKKPPLREKLGAIFNTKGHKLREVFREKEKSVEDYIGDRKQVNHLTAERLDNPKGYWKSDKNKDALRERKIPAPP